MKNNNFVVFIIILLGWSCTQNVNHQSHNDDIKWRIYKALYLLTENQKTSSRYTNNFVTRNCFADSVFVKSEKIAVSNYLLLDLFLYKKAVQNDTVTYLIETKYQNKCVSPIYAIAMPDYVSIFNNKIVSLKCNAAILNTLYYNNNDSVFVNYLQRNANNINPWLFEEAKRRGVFDK